MKHSSDIIFSGFVLAFVLFMPQGHVYSQSQGQGVQIQVNAPSSLSFTSNQSAFTLSFTNFTSGSVSDTPQITYTLQANNVHRTEDVIVARLDALFDGMDFQADFQNYNRTRGNAHLVESQSGYVTVPTVDVGLADKVIDQGQGRRLDGNFTVVYRAVATQDLEAVSNDSKVDSF